ncbi:hypothetical protein ABPG72_015456 [Tetrahymena utriculariae]
MFDTTDHKITLTFERQQLYFPKLCEIQMIKSIDKKDLINQLIDDEDIFILPQDIDLEIKNNPDILNDQEKFDEFLKRFDIQSNLFMKDQLRKFRYYPYNIPNNKNQQLNFIKEICNNNNKLQQHQRFFPKIINPQSPYKCLLIFHNVGTGKTMSAISIAETFREQSHDNKIFVIIPGPLQRDNWENDLAQFIGPKITGQQEDNKKTIIMKLSDQYKIYTRKAFIDAVSQSIEMNEKRVDLGRNQFEDQFDTLSKLNGALVIIDEVHPFVGTSYSEVFIDILKRSKDVKLIMLSATSIKNKIDDILEIINYTCLIKGKQPYKKTDLFEYGKYVDDIKLKPSKQRLLQSIFQGYVSYFFNNLPFVFPTRITHGQSISDREIAQKKEQEQQKKNKKEQKRKEKKRNKLMFINFNQIIHNITIK